MAVAGAAIMITSGCTTSESGEGSPQSTALPASPNVPTSEGDSLPANGAPQVDRPLDIATLLQQPCDVLTDAEIEEFFGERIAPTSDVNAPTGPDCHWQVPRGPAGISVIFPQLDERGLSSLYANRDNLPLFEEMSPVDGYPVVAYSTDRRHDDECTLRIGTSDRETIDITLYLGESKIGQLDPCQAVRDQVATAMIRNIKARQ
ncbi:hypothetical protein BAY60_06885 [Prauserella muralis]|uniref:DUF3558 domain-containing protein n=2 Tax=Prauserella muralis TaxID=588067 RepID=A0A2V4BC79_9PSEU|nr:hypothetical protein BAY60_06885 [Prauserella muralis]